MTGAKTHPPFKSFSEFWPYYLSEHRMARTRQLHFVGSSAALVCLILAVWKGWTFLGLALLLGYGFSWIGHYAFEHNRPASFHQPVYSFLADWKMWSLILTGRLDQEFKKLEGSICKH